MNFSGCVHYQTQPVLSPPTHWFKTSEFGRTSSEVRKENHAVAPFLWRSESAIRDQLLGVFPREFGPYKMDVLNA